MTTRNRSRSARSGQSLVEFTFVGIPLMFVLISIFEISRGMWMYHTLAYSVKEGVRYAIVHGVNCTQGGNTCQVNMGPANTVGTVSWVIRQAGVGLDLKKTSVTFIAGGNTTTCSLDNGGGTSPCPFTQWPPPGANQLGQTIEIDITTPFRSAIAMLWPGAKPASFAARVLGASSSDSIQF
jgi:hypothetical protein